jgi:hypothetical protein
MAGCDCSGNSNYFGSLSTSMDSLPTSDYGLLGGGLGANSGAFITGTNNNQQQVSHFTNQNNSISNVNPMSNQMNNNMNNHMNNNTNNNMNNQPPVPQQPQVQPPLRPKNIQNVPQVEVRNNVVKPTPAPVQQPMKCPNPLNKNGLLLVVLLLAGLAWHEVIRVNIVKSIKCGDGTSQYYMYYAVVASVVGAFLMFR